MKESKNSSLIDSQTGMLNRVGFGRSLGMWTHAQPCKISLFYFSIEEFSRIFLVAGIEKENEYLKSISVHAANYLKSPYILGRIAEGGFVIAVNENMTEQEKSNFAKNFSLEIMWKIKIHGVKYFVNPRYHYITCPEEGDSVKGLLTKLIEEYYSKLSKDLPMI